jgi:hypothetical protein
MRPHLFDWPLIKPADPALGRPARIFVNSMSDVFLEEVGEEAIQRVFDVMARAHWHDFLILTKRHERMLELAPRLPWPANVWMGVSVENRRWARPGAPRRSALAAGASEQPGGRGPGMTAPWQDFAPRGENELRHGYTLDDLRRLAGGVVKHAWSQLGDQADRLEVAWSAIAEALYASESTPTRRELFQAGMDAMSRHDAQDRHHHGVAWSATQRYTGFGSSPSFQTYWCLARTSPSPEDGVVERTALTQIWPRLSEGQRRALLALAAFDDYAAAAKALGIKYQSFHTLVRTARLRFLALWHEGETPSRIWGRDRRIWRRNAGPPAEHRPVTVRMRAAAKRWPHPVGPPTFRHGLTGYKQHRCRCEVCVAAMRAAWRRENRRRQERRQGKP